MHIVIGKKWTGDEYLEYTLCESGKFLTLNRYKNAVIIYNPYNIVCNIFNW